MTEKRCTNCKYTKGIGYDFWCGEGHTEYEVFGAETNCPYYEYHDWSKGTPSRTEKRFTANYQNNEIVSVYDNGKLINIEQMVECLNNLYEENQTLQQVDTIADLETQIMHLKEELNHYKKRFTIVENDKNYLRVDDKTNERFYLNEKEIVECLNNLHEEKEYWKKRALLLENKYNEGDSIEWLRNNTVWEQMPTNRTTYTRTDMK